MRTATGGLARSVGHRHGHVVVRWSPFVARFRTRRARFTGLTTVNQTNRLNDDVHRFDRGNVRSARCRYQRRTPVRPRGRYQRRTPVGPRGRYHQLVRPLIARRPSNSCRRPVIVPGTTVQITRTASMPVYFFRQVASSRETRSFPRSSPSSFSPFVRRPRRHERPAENPKKSRVSDGVRLDQDVRVDAERDSVRSSAETALVQHR